MSNNWKWFGNAGHFIGGQWCRFHLCTQVGDYLISTVGQLLWDEGVREITAQCRGITLEGKGDMRLADYMKKIGYEPLGAGPELFETMVFKAGKPCADKDCNCGMPLPSDWSELAATRYITAGDATKGHYKFCKEWAVKK